MDLKLAESIDKSMKETVDHLAQEPRLGRLLVVLYLACLPQIKLKDKGIKIDLPDDSETDAEKLLKLELIHQNEVGQFRPTPQGARIAWALMTADRLYTEGITPEPVDLDPATVPHNRNTRLLDLGCGSGRLTRKFSSQSSGPVIGIDRDPLNLAVARAMIRYSETSESSDRPAFVCGDVEQLPFKDGSFQLVACRGLFPYIDNLKVVEQLAGLVRPDGRVFIQNHNWRYFAHDLYLSIISFKFKKALYSLLVLLNGALFHLLGKQFSVPSKPGRIPIFITIFNTNEGLKDSFSRYGFAWDGPIILANPGKQAAHWNGGVFVKRQ
ncbi:class I SAM-dependent methyltransferase [candidate division KSB1 bacterium]